MKLSLFTTVTALALTTPTLYAIQDEESTHAVAKTIESYENYLIDVKGGVEDVDIMKMVASKSNKSPNSTSKSNKRSSSSHSKSNKRSSSTSKSKKTKRSYSSYSKSNKGSNRCVPDDSPRPRHSREGRFRFNLVRSDARCVDRDGELYQYGEFDGIRDFTECADACVNDVSRSLLTSGEFQGIDFDCGRRRCRCLYSEGALNSRSDRNKFDRTSRSGLYGYGAIEGGEKTRSSRDMYCGKLAGARVMDGIL